MEALQRLHNRGSISTGYDIDNSVKLEPDNAEFLKRNQADGNTRTWTYSMWVKRTELGMSAGMALFYAGVLHQATRIFFDAGSNAEKLTIDLADNSTTQYRWITKRLFRDTSAWYHFVWRIDTTQSTATDRMRMYVNGVLLTADDFQQTATFPQNTDTTANDANLGGQQQMAIGNYSWANNNGIYAGYAAQCALVDGESLAPTEFGEFDEDTGIWKPKDISGLNYGTGNNSFLLDFETASDLGANAKGNDANFTANNITSADQAVDTPTNNFAMISVAMRDNSELLYSTVSEGGTKFRCTAFDTWKTAVSSIGVTKGKWYAEFKVIGARPNNFWGIASMEQLDNNSGYSSGAGSHLGQSGKNWSIGYYQANGNLFQVQNSGYTNVSWGGTVSQNAVVSVALDMDNHKLYMAVNNTYQDSGNPVTGANAITFDATETVAIASSGYSLGSGNDTILGVNFGGYVTGGMYSQATDENGYGAFRYAPPSGYYALCTKNLEEFG